MGARPTLPGKRPHSRSKSVGIFTPRWRTATIRTTLPCAPGRMGANKPLDFFYPQSAETQFFFVKKVRRIDRDRRKRFLPREIEFFSRCIDGRKRFLVYTLPLAILREIFGRFYRYRWYVECGIIFRKQPLVQHAGARQVLKIKHVGGNTRPNAE